MGLGRDTSTSDGFGIAWAIAKHLVEESRCFTLFATHFHELAALEDVVQGVRNRHATAAVDAASGRLTFLYSLADGAADESYGGHCAELAGFPARVVESARRRAADFEAGSDFGATGKQSKRAKTQSNSEEALPYVFAAQNEGEFAKRAIERAGELTIGCH